MEFREDFGLKQIWHQSAEGGFIISLLKEVKWNPSSPSHSAHRCEKPSWLCRPLKTNKQTKKQRHIQKFQCTHLPYSQTLTTPFQVHMCVLSAIKFRHTKFQVVLVSVGTHNGEWGNTSKIAFVS